MAIQIKINNGSGLIDYTKYVEDGTLKVEDSINVPNLCDCTMGNIDNAFVVPVRNSYMTVFSTKESRFLFTGFITAVPEVTHLGSAGNVASTGFQRQRYKIQATSDEYLLNIKSLPFVPSFVNQTMGQILAALANTLAPGFFDTSKVQGGDLIPFFQYDPTQKWSDLAKTFCDAARFYYQVVNKQIIFEQYTGTSLGITYDETKGQGTFDPFSLKTSLLTVPPVNDAIVIGDVEPQNIHDDFLIGDGVTSNFPLRHAMFRGSSQLLLQEDWTEVAFSNSWNIFDPQFAFSLGSGSLVSQMSASGALGTEYIQSQSGVELGGHLDLQHGEFFFTGLCNGLVGGAYSSSPPTQANCVLGFQLSSPVVGSQQLTPLAADTFSVPDNNDLTAVDSNWAYTSGVGVLPVSGGQIGNPGFSNFPAVFWKNVSWPADQYCQITVVRANDSGALVGCAVRIDPGGARNYYQFVFAKGHRMLQRITNGTSSIVTLQSDFVTPTLGDVYTLIAQGTQISVLVNGRALFSVTDATYSSGFAGIPVGNAAGHITFDCAFDNWVGGSVSTASVQVTTTFSGASGVQIAPILNGAVVPGSTPVVTKINHHYFLETFITARRWSRYDQIYRTLAGTPFGDTQLSTQAEVTFIVWDIDLLHPESPVPTKYYTTASLPSFGLYVPLNAQQLNLTLNYTLLNQPPQGLLTVQSLYGPTGLNLPIKTPGPAEPYRLGSGFGQQVATITASQGTGFGATPDALQFYAGSLSNLNTWVGGTIPAAGARIRLRSWEAGKALARVQDPVSIAKEAAIVGDNGLRTAIFADLNPLPRTSDEAALAASATILDRESPQYDGSYTVYDYFRDKTQDFPRSGRILSVNAPKTRSISGAQFLVRSINSSIESLPDEIIVATIEFGQDLFVEKLLKRFLPSPTNILGPKDSAIAPQSQTLNNLGTMFTNDLLDVSVLAISGNQVFLDLGALPATGVEIRRVDSGWNTSSAGLTLKTTNRFVTLQRTQYEQIWYIRQVNGAAVSRFSRVIRVVYPLIPAPPYAVANIATPLRPVISVGLTGDLRNLRFTEIRDSDNATLLFQSTFASYADLIFTYDNSIALKRSFNWFVYFANLQNEYSIPFNFNFQIPAPVCSMVVDEQSVALAVSVTGIQVNRVDFVCYKDAALTVFAASGSSAVNFAVSGVNVTGTGIAVTFPLTVDDMVGQRYFIARATDPLGTGVFSAAFSHIYTAQGLVSFDNTSNVRNIAVPPAPGTDPVVPAPLQPYAGDIINEGWNLYVRGINRQFR